MNTSYDGDDRVRQVNWLNQEAADIVDADMSDGQSSAEELVAFWEEGAEKPEWFDNSDRDYLIKQVAKNLVS
jgi:hypothetical protein